MKKFSLLLVFIVTSSVVFSQNYQPYNKTNKAWYVSNSYNSLASFEVQNTIQNSDGSETHYHRDIFYGRKTNNQCLIVDDVSWMGTHSIMTPTTVLFFNKNQDTILFDYSKQLNESWVMMTDNNGDNIIATVTAHHPETFLGVTDSVKTITLNLDNVFVPNHPINGEEIKLSKNYGLVKTTDFYLFPYYSNTSLKGHDNIPSSPHDITFDDIFNFDVGDEIHVKDYNFLGPNTTTAYTAKRIFNKSVINNGETIIYDIDRFWVLHTVTPMDTTFIHDTIVETYHLSDWAALNTPENGLIPNSNGQDASIIFLTTPFNNRMKKQLDKNGATLSGTNCWEYDIHICMYDYIDGLGGPYGICNQRTLSLEYYKKGSEEWGTAFNFNALTSTKTTIRDSNFDVQISPNPMNEQTTFQIETEERYKNLTLTVFNVMGQAIKTISSNGDNQMILDRNGLTSGVYFYQIQSEGLVLDSGKLMVQ